jgi:hypothetical protein
VALDCWEIQFFGIGVEEGQCGSIYAGKQRTP